MRVLRDDQSNTLQALRDTIAGGHRRIVLQCPTGYGKTVLAAAAVESARAKGKKVLFTVPAISLIDQTVEMFYSQGIDDIGVIQATHEMTDWSKPVQIASVQTLQNRERLPDADVAFVDECHRWHKFYEKWFCDPAWQNVPIIGMSATPWTKGLGTYFCGPANVTIEERTPCFIRASTTQQLIDAGLLAPFKVFAPSHPDLSGVRTVAGDYHEGELSAKMQEGALVADAVDTWLKLGEDRPTLCYGVDRLHAQHLQAKFEAAGVPCAYQDAHTNDMERKKIKADFHAGRVKVVCNVGTLTVGIDWDVRCISMCRPTKSDMLFVQIVGRGLRTAAGKDDCLILDHSDNHLRLGFVTEIDTSYVGLHVGKTPVTANRTDSIRLPKECPQCAYLKPPHMAKCPACGFVAQAVYNGKPDAGELRELKPKPKQPDLNTFDKQIFYSELLAYSQSKGYSGGWASHKFRERTGVWPNHYKGIAPASSVSAPTLNWIKSRMIAYARGKQRAKQRAGLASEFTPSTAPHGHSAG